MRRPVAAKRSANFARCCATSSVVGTSTATWRPPEAATKAARIASSVLPKPTSPHTTRSIGVGEVRSATIASEARRWSAVGSCAKASRKAAKASASIGVRLAARRRAARARLQEPRGGPADRLGGAAPGVRPARRAERVERRRARRPFGERRDEVERGHRHVQLRLVGVAQRSGTRSRQRRSRCASGPRSGRRRAPGARPGRPGRARRRAEGGDGAADGTLRGEAAMAEGSEGRGRRGWPAALDRGSRCGSFDRPRAANSTLSRELLAPARPSPSRARSPVASGHHRHARRTVAELELAAVDHRLQVQVAPVQLGEPRIVEVHDGEVVEALELRCDLLPPTPRPSWPRRCTRRPRGPGRRPSGRAARRAGRSRPTGRSRRSASGATARARRRRSCPS